MQVSDNRRGITVGIFIFLGLVIFLLGIFTLGGQKKTFVKSFKVDVVFDDIQGLKSGNNVWFSGVKIGTIKKIGFYGTSQVLVTMSIEEEAHRYIHKDAAASIGSDGLIGNKIIVINGGSPKFPFVEDGDRLQVDKTLSTDDIMKTLQVNNKNLVDITNNFKALSGKIVKGEGMVGALLTDSLLANNFRTIVNNLNATTVKTNQMTAELARFSTKLNTKGGMADEFLTDTVVFSSLKTSIAELQKTASEASKLTNNLNAASGKLNQKDNALGVLLNDEQTAQQLKNTVSNLELSTKKLDQNMEALQSNFLFRGFFKKKAKEEASKTN